MAAPTRAPVGEITKEQIVSGFQELRQQQRAIASKISELELEKREHEMVAAALEEIDPGRRCFRQLGGVLVERTVGEVLPAIKSNQEKILQVINTLNSQLEAKGVQLNEFRVKHNIRVRDEENKADEEQKPKASHGTGVLVSTDHA